MKKDAQIDEICNREQKTVLAQEYLFMAFFLISVVFVIFLIINIKSGNAEMLVGQCCAYAISLFVGYFWYQHLERRLKLLWEQKKSIIISQP